MRWDGMGWGSQMSLLHTRARQVSIQPARGRDRMFLRGNLKGVAS